MKVLIATEKPFAPAARDATAKILKEAGHEVVLLESYTDKSELLKAVTDVDALVVRSDKVTAEVLAAAKQLKIVVRGGAGYDNIDCGKAKENGIVVENTPGQNSNAVAELAFTIMLNLARNNFQGKTGSELKGKTLCLHAFGYAAQAVAALARGFEMKLYSYDPYVDVSVMSRYNVKSCSSVEELFGLGDYVSLHIPAIPETIKSINYGLLSKLKDKATLINTARKEVINEADLLTFCAERPNFKYGADVAPSDEVKKELLEKYPTRIFFTPKKMAAETAEANYNAACAAGQQIVAFFESGDTTFQVNK
ncbi:3-phosphoglycerate dehydrogenase [bacterium]|nr:3-phosphoglycerate dehydrogenase [bacterium]